MIAYKAIHRWHYGLGVAFLIALAIGAIYSWRAIDASLEAEKTLGAYCLVMDILTVYVIQHSGEWPRAWDDLISTVPEGEYGGWQWPTDIGRIRDRVEIDFSVRTDELVSQSPEQFCAVKQIGPNYGSREGNVHALLQAIRDSVEGSKKVF